MKFGKHIKELTLVAGLVIGLTACSSKPDIKEFPKSANAKQEIGNLEMAIENSRSEEYDILAPVSFKEAKTALKNARKMEKDDKSKEKVLKEVALGQAYLDRAKDMAEDNREKLRDVIIARDAALAANADTLLPGKLANLDKKIKEETIKIENDKDDKLKEKRAQFITSYLDLELAAIKKQHLGEARFLIDESVKNGAQNLAPKTLASANEKYKEADLFITKHRNNTAEIEIYSAVALEEARKLEGTTAAARGLTAATPEETALRMQAEDERLTRTQEALEREKGVTESLSATNTQLSEEQKLNAIYEDARKRFSPEEAEVYKQGDKLVIRLKALQFPKSQAVIQGDNFALLKKVEDVISEFDQSKVIVEGHTDSTGGKELNQKLSEQRAEAVKKYLEANASEMVTDIEAEGFGFEKPLASNKTPQGRAQNRRVDVIITPVSI